MKMELGAQTFTVRDYMQTTWDFREAMKRIAEIGYTCVQLSAVGNVPVQAQRDICDEYGLKIVLTHTNPDRMIADPEGVIRDHDILGCDYIGIGMMNPKYQRAEWIDQFAKDFTTPAKKMRDAGKLLMYHNHNLEWTRLRDGRRIMDVLLEQMPADLMGVTLDTYWVQAAGADVLEWIDILQDRIPCPPERHVRERLRPAQGGRRRGQSELPEDSGKAANAGQDEVHARRAGRLLRRKRV